ncbi:hypothetical protein HQQ94_21090 [Shewanella sp. VB17]|uniref:hypothetical protein n=1 Tax=Shewanella sp. VB17 TaxID=2739432 RepID=UPI00156766E2|nr:hypothetical protein [Shewanella sp. VB17]NRD75670.1 hypothetical protein [Shewanella sp. VB17]
MSNSNKLAVGSKPAVFLVSSAIFVACIAVSARHLSTPDTSLVCSTESAASYNTSLPASHPNNRCVQQSKELNWANWFTGNSRSNQLHFVDLLELLYGHKESPLDNVPINDSKIMS